MKSRILRTAGIALSLLVPAGSVAVLGSGTAGATTLTQATLQIRLHITFTTGTGVSSLVCPTPGLTLTNPATKLVSMLAITPTRIMWKNKTFGTGCVATGTPGGGIGTATTITFDITSTGLLFTIPKVASFYANDIRVVLKLATTFCTITFTTTIPLTVTGKTLSIPSTHTKTTTVTRTSGSGLKCGLVRLLLHTTTSTFTGSITSTTTWTSL